MGLTNNKGSKLQSTRKRKAAAHTNNNNWTRDLSLSVFVWEDSISKSWLCVRRIGEQEEEEQKELLDRSQWQEEDQLVSNWNSSEHPKDLLVVPERPSPKDWGSRLDTPSSTTTKKPWLIEAAAAAATVWKSSYMSQGLDKRPLAEEEAPSSHKQTKTLLLLHNRLNCILDMLLGLKSNHRKNKQGKRHERIKNPREGGGISQGPQIYNPSQTDL